MKQQIILFSILLINFSACKLSQNSVLISKSKIQQVDSLILAEHAANHFDGTIVIGTKDKIIYQKAIGIANRNWNVPMTLDARFDIASLNKSFQAGLILLASEEGKIKLTDKLSEFFPNNNFNPKITLHHLLTHTSGLANYNGIDDKLEVRNYQPFKRFHFENSEYVDFIDGLEMIGQPDEQFYYSNFAYHLIPIILEQIYQQPFNEILQEKICQPYNLKNTFSETQNQIVHQKVAEAYNYDKGEKSFYRNNFIDLTLGRRIFSTSEDLYKWTRLLNNGKILSKKSYQLMITNHTKSINKNIAYGYGFVVSDGGNYQMGNINIEKPYIIHGGATEGYKAMLTNVNKGEIIVTHLSNIGHQTNELKLTKKIIHILLDEKNSSN